MVFTEPRLGARGGRALGGQEVDRLGVGIDGGLQGLDGCGEHVQGGLEVTIVTHGAGAGR